MMIEIKYTDFIEEEQILGCRLFAGWGLVDHQLRACKALL